MKDEKKLKKEEIEKQEEERLSILPHSHVMTGHAPAASAGKVISGAGGAL
jgi:hypothetical protein